MPVDSGTCLRCGWQLSTENEQDFGSHLNRWRGEGVLGTLDWNAGRTRVESWLRRKSDANGLIQIVDAEDLSQEVLVTALRKLDTFKHDDNPNEGIQAHFEKWLYGIAKNKFMEYSKRQTSHNSRIEEMGESGCEEIETCDTSSIDRMEAIEMAEGMQDILSGLSPAIREFAPYYFGGFSTEEIADRLGIELVRILHQNLFHHMPQELLKLTQETIQV